MANNTQIKIRYGLILQAVLAQALRNAGYSFAETPNYDANSEVPDFLIPDAENPKFMVEVHQTEARNSFQMKTLRAFTAVAEAKAFFGANVVSVNVLFGNPDKELPAANLQAMCGIFDINIILRSDATPEDRIDLQALETAALEMAKSVSVTTSSAAAQLSVLYPAAVAAMGRVLNLALISGSIKKDLSPMWESELARRAALGDSPDLGDSTFYKKNMVRSLFFTDSDFAAIATSDSPNDWPESAKKQAVLTGIADIVEEIDGDYLIVDPEFLAFTTHADTPQLRQMCSDVLVASAAMRSFFEDIRDGERRQRMSGIFLESLGEGIEKFEDDFRTCFENGDFSDIEHARCWLADLAPLCVNKSHNYFNNKMKDHPDYTLRLGNPCNNITIRSPRLGRDVAALEVFQHVFFQVFRSELDQGGAGAGADISVGKLSDRLLKLRMVGAMRLQFLEPLQLMTRTIANACGLAVEDSKLTTVLSDFGGVAEVGAFDFREISNPATGQTVLFNAIAAEGNPRDKAKEWGARMLARLYRHDDGVVKSVDDILGIFVIDGIWAQSDVTRLYRCGWNLVIRMGDLEGMLKEVFGVSTPVARMTPLPPIPEEDDNLPMAAED
jgi:hypothetical protein